MQRLALEYLWHSRQRFPEKTAVVDGNKCISFAELWEQSLLLGQQIKQRVPASGHPIVIDMHKSIEAVIAILAAQWSGNVYVPFDPETPSVRRQRMLETLGDAHVLSVCDAGFELDGALISLSGDGSGQIDVVEQALRAGLAERKNIDPL